MGVFSGGGGVLVIAALVLLIGLAVIVGMTVGLHQRDCRQRTQDADAWASAGFGIPQWVVDRALATPDATPYPDEPAASGRGTRTAKRTTAKRTTAKRTTAKKSASRTTGAKPATRRA